MDHIVNPSFDPPFPIPRESSCSPKLLDSVETLDKPPPTAPVRALVVPSPALSSPSRDDKPSSPAETLQQFQTPDGSTSSTPETREDPTLVPSSIDFENVEGLHSQVSLEAHVLTANDGESKDSTKFENSSHSPGENDDTSRVEPAKLGWNPCSPTWTGAEQEPPKIEPTGVGSGLFNLGNTCFMNSVLQCFTHTVPFLESLCSYKHLKPCYCGSKELCVMEAVRDHIELALRSSGHHISPVRFVENLHHFSPSFQKYHQEDAHEFLQSFLDKLERCCLNLENKTSYVSSQAVNFVEHVFGGRLVSRLRCCNCDSFSNTYEPSLGVSLEIEAADDLASALESFTSIEKLEDEFTCDNCNEKVSKEKQLMLDKLPPVATFHLKRFKNDGISSEKIFKHVGFPLELDLQPYMRDIQDNVSTTYHLYALVEHLGSSLTYGHYSSYVRSAHETWHKFDDSQVTRIEEQRVLSSDAYILFYAREGTPWFSVAFEQMKPWLELKTSNSSPVSVLDPVHVEDNIDHSRPDKPLNLVDQAFQTMENPVSCCPEPLEEVFHSAEPPELEPEADDYDDVCIESTLQEEATVSPGGLISSACIPVPVVPAQPCFKPQQENTFQIQWKHLEAEKKRKESLRIGSRSKVAEGPERDIARRYLNSRPSCSRTRMLAAAMAEGEAAASQTKRTKTTHNNSTKRICGTRGRSFPQQW